MFCIVVAWGGVYVCARRVISVQPAPKIKQIVLVLTPITTQIFKWAPTAIDNQKNNAVGLNLTVLGNI